MLWAWHLHCPGRAYTARSLSTPNASSCVLQNYTRNDREGKEGKKIALVNKSLGISRPDRNGDLEIKICFQVWHWGGMKYTQLSLSVGLCWTVKAASKLSCVGDTWPCQSPNNNKKSCLPLKHASISRHCEGSWQRKCWCASSGDPCALLCATASQAMLYPQPEPPSNSRALNFVKTLFRNSPHCHGHITACHSHQSSWATALLRRKAQAVPCRTAPLLLAGRLLQPWAKPSTAQGMSRGNELVPYSDCFNSVTFMYWKLKPECSF